MDPSQRGYRTAGAARQRGALLLLFGLLVVLLFVTSSARLEEADFVFNNGTEVQTLDPAVVSGVPEGRVMFALYEGLTVKHPETLEPLPGMAESWELSEDGRTYTFHIRANASWSNDDPLTAADFEWSWRRLLEPETAAEYAYQAWYIENAKGYTLDQGVAWEDVGVDAVDERTLVVRLENPTPFFLQLTSFYPLFPVHRGTYEWARAEFPDTWQAEWVRPGNLVTNGPFLVEERRVNDRIRLVKNPRYWDASSVAFDRIDILAVEHYGTMLNLYLTGGVDWIDRCPPNLVPRMLPREDFDPRPYLGSYFFRVNVNEPPLDDARVRRALALTIDRRAICEKIMKKGEVPLWSLSPPGMPGYDPPEMDHAPVAPDLSNYDEAFAADCAEAGRLIAEAGYGPGEEGGRPFPTIEIHYNTSEAHRDVAEVLADTWKKVLGIDAKLLNQEWKVYLDTQNTIAYDVSRSAWIGDYPDPNTFVDLFQTGGENNRTGWGNPRYDELVALAASEMDPLRRMELLAQAEAILMEELPILPVYAYATQNVVNPRLGGFHENVQDVHYPKFWYWLSDEELAAKRAQQPPGWEIVPAPGPSEGLYPPGREGGSGR